jgi:hypothetical protein
MSLIFLRIYMLSNWSSACSLLYSKKIQTTNAGTGTQQRISILNAQDEIGMNRKRMPLFCCRLNWPQLSTLQLAYAAVSATQRERLREVCKEGALIVGGVLSQKKPAARKRVRNIFPKQNKPSQETREKSAPPTPPPLRPVV